MEELFRPARFETEGSVKTEHGAVSYRVISEDYVIKDEKGEPEASVFSFSYLRTDAGDPSRPVAFFYNGGPGSACVWLHAGFLGPWRMKYADAVHPPVTPPYEMEENPNWLGEVCDIVLIDPVGCGYSRLLQPEKAEKYYHAGRDAACIADFIEDWLRKYGRRNSPVYLGGESYGTIRTPLVMEELMGGPLSFTGKMRGISVKGIFLLGTVLDIQAAPLPAPKEPMDLYTMAATAWHHAPEGKGTLREHLEAAWDFGSGEYLRSLFLKNGLSAEERERTAERLTYFTGIDAAYYRSHDLRISLAEFAERIGKGVYDVGAYDTRYTMPHLGLGMPPKDPVIDDPAMGAYTPSMTGAMESILKGKLGITFDRAYRAIEFSGINGLWKYEYRAEPKACIELAARRNPDFHVFMAAGLYDLVTTPGYARALENHLDVPKGCVIRREYESGHMAYLGEESQRALVSDMRAFFGQ